MIDGLKFRSVLGHYPTGVCAVTAIHEGKPVAMIVGSFTSVSLDPPLVAFFPGCESSSWPKIRAAGAFCINVVGAHQMELCKSLSSKAEDKFSDVPFRLSSLGSPMLEDALAWIDCELAAVEDAGDHYMAMGLVKHLEAGQLHDPLLFHRGGYGRFNLLTSSDI
jgi:3-hydroxy-9,10-secoandrosta-1,3,5(10)-triene-9,17-dione monooxygenase reductase component